MGATQTRDDLRESACATKAHSPQPPEALPERSRPAGAGQPERHQEEAEDGAELEEDVAEGGQVSVGVGEGQRREREHEPDDDRQEEAEERRPRAPVGRRKRARRRFGDRCGG